MAHLISAEIVGLAGKTTPIKIAFDRHVNIVYGPNGTGKTSLLKILHAAMRGEATLLQSVPFTEATVRVYSIDDHKEYVRTISKKEARTRVQAEFELLSTTDEEVGFDPVIKPNRSEQGSFEWTESPKRPKQSKRGSLTRWRHSYLPTSRLHVGEVFPSNLTHLLAQGSGQLTEDLLDRYFADTLDQLWGKYNSDVLVAVRAAQERGLASILKAVLAGSESP